MNEILKETIIQYIEETDFTEIAALFEAFLVELPSYVPNMAIVAEILTIVRQKFEVSNDVMDISKLESVQGQIIDYLSKNSLLNKLIADEFGRVKFGVNSHFTKIMMELQDNRQDLENKYGTLGKITTNVNKFFAVLNQDDKSYFYREYCNPQKKYTDFNHFKEVMETIFTDELISLDSLESICDLDALNTLVNKKSKTWLENICWLRKRINESDLAEFDDEFGVESDFIMNGAAYDDVDTVEQLHKFTGEILTSLCEVSNSLETDKSFRCPSPPSWSEVVYSEVLNGNGKRTHNDESANNNNYKKQKIEEFGFFGYLDKYVANRCTMKSEIRFDFLKDLKVREEQHDGHTQKNKFNLLTDVISFMATKLTSLKIGIELSAHTNWYGILAISFSPEIKQLLPIIETQFNKVLNKFTDISDKKKLSKEEKNELYKEYFETDGITSWIKRFEQQRQLECRQVEDDEYTHYTSRCE